VGAIACAGAPTPSGTAFTPSGADIVLYDLTQTPPAETKRLGLGTSLGAGIQPELAFADETTIFATTYGGNATAGDTAFSVTTSGTVKQIASETMPDVYGGVACNPACSDVCLVTDSQANAVARWSYSNGTFTAMSSVNPDPTVGLPPHDLGGVL
jgi:hypothetical protein